MDDIHFYLKKPPGKDGKCLVYLQLNYYSVHRFKMSIKETISPDQWDASRELPRKSYKHYHTLRRKIDLFKDTTESVYKDFTSQLILPTVDQLKAAVKAKIDPAANSRQADLIHYLTTFIENRAKASTYSPGTIQTYQSLKEDLCDYQKTIRFDSIDVKWLNSWVNHLNNKILPNGKHLEQNTVSKKLSTLRTILNEAREDGVNTSLAYQSKRVKSSRVETTKIYLSEDEIERFYRVPCSGVLEEARDIFVLMCYTGPRISDVWKISRSTFFVQDGMEYFSFNQKKTKNPVHIPVHPFVRDIMEKYNWELPTKSRQRISDHIKVLGKMAGIDQLIDLVTYPGSVMTITKKPKWSEISTHTARRSLACNMLLAGVPEKIVMSVGGWKSSKSFQPYVRLTADDKLKVASRSHFFTGARVIAIGG